MFRNFRKGIRIRIEGTLAVKNDIGIEVEVGDALCVRVGVHDSLHLGVVDIFRNAHFGDVLHIYGICRPPIPNDGLVARFKNTIAFAVGVRQFVVLISTFERTENAGFGVAKKRPITRFIGKSSIGYFPKISRLFVGIEQTQGIGIYYSYDLIGVFKNLL